MTDVMVETRALTKRFGGVSALEDVSLSIERGTVHALVGENGAGKSTLANLVAGVCAPDSGEILIDGAAVRYRTPREAAEDGVVAVAQEIMLVPQRSVIENVFLGAERAGGGPRRHGRYDRRALRRRFEALSREVGIRVPAEAKVGTLGVGVQQQVEILRALARGPRVLILDEPTAALTGDEAESLLRIVAGLRAGGTTIIYVSHLLEEVLRVADAVTILRDGRLVRTAVAAAESPTSLIEGMVGRKVGLAFPGRDEVGPDAAVALAVEGLSSEKIGDLSFEIRAGEILGVAGRLGSGRTSLASLLFGLTPPRAGTIELFGESLRIRSPRDAIEAGIALVPESRKDQGLVMSRSTGENIALAHGADVAPGGFVDRRRERAVIGELIDRLEVHGRADQPVWQLSGGNQQKVVLAKWLWRSTRLLIVDEPTRGIDIAAKQAMYRLIAGVAERGSAVLMISSEVEELIGLSDRVIILADGRLLATLGPGEIDGRTLMRAGFGDPPDPRRRSGEE